MTDSRRTAWFWTAVFATLALCAGGWGIQQHRRLGELDFAQRRVALLQAENDRLRGVLAQREKSAALASDVALRKPIEESIAKIRGLNFQHPVTYDVLTRAGIKKVIEQKLTEQYSEQELKDMATGLEAFGLLPPAYPLRQKYIDLLGEQIAAFYDQHQHKLFMFEDASLQNTQNRIVLAHELTHALQDQNFGLLKMPLEIKNNDDLALATSALIEGDATIAMSDFMLQNFTLKTLREGLSGMFSQNMEQLQKAPRYLREMLVFPYLRGQEFCMALRERGGEEAISGAFRNPPVSSAQILHPAKYFAHEEPVRVEFGDTTALGQKPLADNVLGEEGIRILFTEWIDAATGQAASEGWRGDRCLVFDGGRAVVWKTVWADSPAAARFSEALMKYAEARFGNGQTTTVSSGESDKFIASSSPQWLWGHIGCSGGGENGIYFIWAMKKDFFTELDLKFGR